MCQQPSTRGKAALGEREITALLKLDECGGSLQLGECKILTEKRFLNNTGS